jgi:3-oxoacyl-[acyl-carrier protein] reductase
MSEQQLSKKVAIVTGASKGIGAGIARAFAAAGASVVVNYATGGADAERVVADITEKGGTAIAVQADMSVPADVKRLFERTRERFDTLDILVNNAGVYAFGPIEELNSDEFHRQFDTNVLGPMVAIQEAVKLFGTRGGAVVNISSVASVGATPNTVIYSATKAALDSLTRVLAHELGPRGIRVNTLLPGPVETHGAVTAGLIGSEFVEKMVAATPLGRIAQPDDIASVALFLASDASRWITGESVLASGGLR